MVALKKYFSEGSERGAQRGRQSKTKKDKLAEEERLPRNDDDDDDDDDKATKLKANVFLAPVDDRPLRTHHYSGRKQERDAALFPLPRCCLAAKAETPKNTDDERQTFKRRGAAPQTRRVARCRAYPSTVE